MKVKPIEEAVRNYVQRSLEAYLCGRKNLNWIKGVIGKSGILSRKGELNQIFTRLEPKKIAFRYGAIFEECKKEGWL